MVTVHKFDCKGILNCTENSFNNNITTFSFNKHLTIYAQVDCSSLFPVLIAVKQSFYLFLKKIPFELGSKIIWGIVQWKLWGCPEWRQQPLPYRVNVLSTSQKPLPHPPKAVTSFTWTPYLFSAERKVRQNYAKQSKKGHFESEMHSSRKLKKFSQSGMWKKSILFVVVIIHKKDNLK